MADRLHRPVAARSHVAMAGAVRPHRRDRRRRERHRPRCSPAWARRCGCRGRCGAPGRRPGAGPLAGVARIGVLTVGRLGCGGSPAWSIQGRYGIPILRYTETYEAVARTSSPAEVLRGLGYWFFYGGDKVDRWVDPSRLLPRRSSGWSWPATPSPPLGAGGAGGRALPPPWLRRRAAPAGGRGRVGRRLSRTATAPLAGRVIEAFVATAGRPGAAVHAAGRAARRARPRPRPRLRRRRRRPGPRPARLPRSGIVVPAVVPSSLLAVAMPPLFTGGEYSAGILRDGEVPADWQAATGRPRRRRPPDPRLRAARGRLRQLPLGRHRRPDHARPHGPPLRGARAGAVGLGAVGRPPERLRGAAPGRRVRAGGAGAVRPARSRPAP